MTAFFDEPILSSPYAEPREHWELDKDGLPTDRDRPAPALLLEVRGFRGHDAALGAATTRTKRIPAVNRLDRFGRWAFAELRDPFTMTDELDRLIAATLSRHGA